MLRIALKWKKQNYHVFVVDMITHLENPKETSERLAD